MERKPTLAELRIPSKPKADDFTERADALDEAAETMQKRRAVPMHRIMVYLDDAAYERLMAFVDAPPKKSINGVVRAALKYLLDAAGK